MYTTDPCALDRADSGTPGTTTDQDSSGAATKLQTDSRPPQQKAPEQQGQTIKDSIEILLLQNGIPPVKQPSTKFVEQTAEQSRQTVNRNVEAVLLGQRRTEPPTNYVEQAAEQNKQTAKEFIEELLTQNGRPPVKSTTNYVDQASEQNKQTVIQNVEAILSGQRMKEPRINYVEQKNSKYQGLNQFFREDLEKSLLSTKEPPTNYVEQAVEQKKDGGYQGLNQFYREDLEKNLIDNVSYALARGNVLADQASDRAPVKLGIVGEANLPNVKDFWHSGNEDVVVSKFVFQNFKAFGQEPERVVNGLKALEQQIAQTLLEANIGKPLAGQDRDQLRQIAENAAMIKLAIAEYRQTNDPKGARALVSGSGHSVNDLIRIASEHGGNSRNLQQLQKMADEIAPR